MLIQRRILGLIVFLAFYSCGLDAGAQALPASFPANPGFETGNLNGWAQEETASNFVAWIDNSGPHSGSYDAQIGVNWGTSLAAGQEPYSDLRNLTALPCTSGEIYLTSYWVNEAKTVFPAGVAALASIFVDVSFSDGSIQREFPSGSVSGNTNGYQQVQGTFQIPYVPGKVAQSFTVAFYVQVSNDSSAILTFGGSASVWARFDDLQIWRQISIGEFIGINTSIATLTSQIANSTNAAYVDAENPSGTIDGTNSNFQLSIAPNPLLSLQLYKNGILLTQSIDYTLNSTAITFSAGALPQPGDSLTASYRH